VGIVLWSFCGSLIQSGVLDGGAVAIITCGAPWTYTYD
jgi:hypothetical protein